MIPRRSFLRSAALATGGLSLSPLAHCLGKTIRAGESGEPPTRFVFFLQGNGIHPEHIQPQGLARPLEPTKLEDRTLGAYPLPSAIAPLEPFKNRLTLLNGLSGRVTGPPGHSADFGALGCYPQREHVFGETIDAAIAKVNPGVFPHLGLGVSELDKDSVIYNVSAWKRDRALPTQCQPTLAFQRLFGGVTEGDSRKFLDARMNVLDFLADDVRRLTPQLNSGEKEKLDTYLDALESIGKRQNALNEAATRIPQFGNSEELPQGAGGFAHLDSHFDLAAKAFITGLTNVAAISSGSGLHFLGIQVDGSELGFSPGRIDLHGLGHHGSFCGASSEELRIAIQRRHSQALARFLTQLQAIPEGEGTMLDHTLVIYLSDQAEGHHPECHEWPFLLIGDLGGRLKTGNRYLRYPWYQHPGHRTTANLYTTLLHAVGAPRERFGLADENLVDLDQSGPLDELLIG